MTGVFLGAYLGSYLGSRVVGRAGSGASDFPGLWPGVAQSDVVAWWDGQDVLQFDKASTGLDGYPYPGDTVGLWRDSAGNVDDATADTEIEWLTDKLNFTALASDERFVVPNSQATFRFLGDGTGGSAFMRVTAGPIPAAAGPIFSTDPISGTRQGVAIWFTNTGALRVSVSNGGVSYIGNVPVVYDDGTELDIVLSTGNGRVKVWVNGVLEIDDPNTVWQTADSTNNLTLGGNVGIPSYEFTGEMEQIVFLDREATEEDVAQFAAWNSPATRWEPTDIASLQAWWDGTDKTTFNTQADGSGSIPSYGDDVLRWEDKVATRALTAAAGVNTPYYDGTLTFVNGLLKDQSADNEDFPDFLLPNEGSAATFFDIVRTSDDAGDEFPFSTFAGAAPYYEIQFIGTTVIRSVLNGSTISNGSWSAGEDLDLGFSITEAGSSTDYSFTNNGSIVSGTAPIGLGDNVRDAIAVGGRSNESAAFIGSIRQAMLFDDALTEAQFAQLNAYNHRRRSEITINYEAALGTPDVVRTDTTDISSAEVSVTSPVYAIADVTFDLTSPEGIIWEQGDSVTGLYLGVANNELILRAGDGGAPSTSTARIAIANADQWAGQRKLLHVRAQGSGVDVPEVELWIQDADSNGNPVGTATRLGEDVATAAGGWAGSDAGAFTDETTGKTVTGEAVGYNNPWNGTGHELRLYESTSAPTTLPTT